MDNLDGIIYYLYKDEKYLDFQTIMYLIDKDKTFTWRLLIKLDLPFIDYQNRRLYKFENLMEAVEIVELLDIEKLGL
jgi:hypothetical protein